jgi:purine nucleosidase/pyrimidine-specific ribonucleoside hydrolase
MGGSVKVPGNIHSDWPDFENEVAEWNIWVDPAAADEVFSSGLDLHLVPLDATRQVLWTQADIRLWRSSGSLESTLATNLLQMMVDAWDVESVYIWDLVAAVQATLPAVCPEMPYALEIVTTPGEQQGRTLVVEQSPNVSVCLDPAPEQIKALVVSTFQQP